MDKELVSMAQQFTGLPMEDLIGAPLNAAAKANAAMALTQTRFMMETCFNTELVDEKGKKVESGTAQTDKDKKTHYVYKPIMIEMSLQRGVLQNTNGVVDIKNFTTTFNLPLLSIIPVNSLAVNNVDITFEMEVKSSYSETEASKHETDKSHNETFEKKIGWGILSSSLKGSASYSSHDSSTHDTHYEKSNSAKYTVNVHAGQLPVPQGVNTIIEAFTQAIQPIEMPAEKETNSGTGTSGNENQ
jgi:hypothetical protein